MKNDILLFVVMFAVAWIGFNVAKDRLQPTAAETVELNAVTSSDGAASKTKDLASPDNSADQKSPEAKTVEREIEQVLTEQTRCWNRGDLDGFMEAYWNSDELTLSRDGETTLGWDTQYTIYSKRYPARAMGKISLKEIKTEMVSRAAAIVTGRFDRQLPDEKKANGSFSLVMKKIDGLWKIVHDQTAVAR